MIYGGIAGQIAVGRYVVEIGEPRGALIRESSLEPAAVRPRRTPILLRPALLRGLVGRETELAAAIAALDAGLPLEVSGDPGIGKTAFLRCLAHHPRGALFADGIIYLSARNRSPVDLLQCVFEAFHESDELRQPTDAEVRRGLQERQALLLLDDVDLVQDELEQIFDAVPRSAFVVATRTRCLWGEGRSIALKGLPVEDAAQLLGRTIERSLDAAEQAAAKGLCAALEGHPLRIVQAASLTRERGLSLEVWAPDVRPDGLITELLKSIDDKQRRALLALTALPAVPLQVQHVSGLAEITDIESSLTTLVRRGLVVRTNSQLRLADGVTDRLRRREDLTPWVNRAITYFTAWAERNRRSPVALLEESDALLRVQQEAAEARRWGEVSRLGRLVEAALVIGGRWGAWAVVLDRCLAAAKATGDRAAEAWALHELGTRAVCLGETVKARAMLGQAVKLREALADDAAAAASGQNLRFVLAPVSTVSSEAPTAPTELDLDTLPLREAARPTAHIPNASRFAAAAIALPLLAGLGWVGGMAFDAAVGRPQGRPESSAAGRSFQPRPERSTAPPVEEPRPVSSSAVLETTADVPPDTATASTTGTDRSNILIFTARPASTRSTQLCYAVSGAYQARIEPGVGEVEPTPTLKCRSVAPRRTTTYELTAYSRDGRHARQQVVVVVR